VKTPSARPIDEEIRSIDPLIERSTENIPKDALRAEPVKNPFEEPPAWHAREVEHTGNVMEKPVEMEPIREIPPPKPVSEPVPPMAHSFGPPGDTPPPPKPPRGGNFLPQKNTLVTGAVALIAILIVAAGVFFVLPMLSGGEPGTGEVTTVPTPSVSATPSTTATLRERPALVIPKTGVQVHVNYLGGFKGSYGMPDMLTSVPGNSGERVWEVENANGTVQATFEKLDGSSHELVVEIYKDGKVLTSGTTTVGHGSVALSVDTITGIAAPPVSSGGGSTSRTPATVAATTTLTVTTAPATTVITTTAAS